MLKLKTPQITTPKESSLDPEIVLQNELETKIEFITHDLSKPYFRNALAKLVKESGDNVDTICDYIIAEINEINIKPLTREGKIKILLWLSNSHRGKSFRNMTKNDILTYLNSSRKSISEDPSQRWIGTYNGRQMILLKFFRWLYNSNEQDQRKRITPICMQGIRRLPKKEKTPYKPSDIWDAREHAVFLKYCPDKRDRCYHAIANDTSARPHEILSLKISDVKFNLTDEGIQYAEIRIKEGKTGPRMVPLFDSIPYLKDWIANHPTGTNPESWLFVAKCYSSYGIKLTYDGLVYRYSYYYKTKYFPKLLDDSNIPDADKAFIRNMLTKPWNLYIFRHSALTEKSQMLPEAILRDHAGWTMSSKMPAIYLHLSGESSKILLQKKGVIKRQDKEASDVLKPKQCPNCFEPNKRDSTFCTKCMMVLKYESYHKTLEEKEKHDLEIKLLKQGIAEEMDSVRKEMRVEMKQELDVIVSVIQQNPLLLNIKSDALVKKKQTIKKHS
jgi:integrase